jgi:hypothetical protein
MTLRELVTKADNPLEASFMIAGFLRTAIQGEPSTYEGDCASIVKAMDTLPFDITTPEGIQSWLTDLGTVPDIDMPDSFWLSMAESAEADDTGEARE